MAKSDTSMLTQAEYARSRKDRGLPGGSREAVRKAVDENRISAFGPDKLIDQELADLQWARNTRARISAQATAQGDLITQAATDATTPGAASPQPAAPASTPAATPPSAPTADPGYVSLRARREAADAERAEIETAKLRGSMVMREDVDRAMFAIAREARDQLNACSRRIASECATATTAEACEQIIDREHRIVLELLASLYREKVGAPATSSGGRPA